MIKNQKGQVVVILLLVMVIALAVGLSTISRSTLEVSTSRKSEDSSRAFSAAEAGIERAIQANINTLGSTASAVPNLTLSNQTSANITISEAGLPLNSVNALSYPPFGKESYAQFWLVYSNYTNIPVASYTANSFNIYFGDPEPNGDSNYYTTHPEEKPAIEVNTIYWDGSSYKSLSKYFDSSSPVRSDFSLCDNPGNYEIDVNNDEKENFYCRANIDLISLPLNSFPVMVRVRILYSNISHPVAIMGTNSGTGIIPKQANVYTSTGTSGSVQRKLEVFHQKSVMPQFFDYVLFSAAALQK